MWLGIAFVAIAIAATILQAWLWSFPMVSDPGGPDPNGKSTAPRFWTAIHRLLGLLFVLIYVVMMVEMVPRLWEYQVELPARTVMHACMGIVLGILLVVKICIIRWFQHFGKSLPSIGLGILTCTIILATLSIPFALQAHDFGSISDPENLVRVRGKMVTLGYSVEEANALVTPQALRSGRWVLTTKCKMCHDMRKVLNKPRSPDKWLSVVRGMARKPTFGDPITEDEIPKVTAYLVAITPDLVQSKRIQHKRVADVVNASPSAKVGQSPVVAETSVDAKPKPEETNVVPESPASDKELYESRCSDCHELDTVEEYVERVERESWKAVVQAMIEDEEAEIGPEESTQIISYLNEQFPLVE